MWGTSWTRDFEKVSERAAEASGTCPLCDNGEHEDCGETLGVGGLCCCGRTFHAIEDAAEGRNY